MDGKMTDKAQYIRDVDRMKNLFGEYIDPLRP